MSKARARHSALQDLANMMIPNLMEDISPEDLKKSMPKDVKKAVEEDDEEDEHEEAAEVAEASDDKPRVFGMSLTQMMGSQKPQKKSAKKRGSKR